MSQQRSVIYARVAIAFLAVAVPLFLFMKEIFGSFLFTFSVPLFWHVGVRGASLRALGITRKNLVAAMLIGIVAGVVLGLLGGIVLSQCGMTGHAYTDLHTITLSFAPIDMTFALQNELGYRLLSMHAVPGSGLLFLLFCVLLVGAGEELFWRGFIQQRLSRYMAKSCSLWLTAALFGMVHWYLFTVLPLGSGALFLVLIALAGALFGYLFERCGSLVAPALSHGIAAFIIWKYYFFNTP
jgi:membrane protease YdiL (CAAX protease family)